MATTSQIKTSDKIDRLIQAIDGAIAMQTRQSPMSIDDIIGVLALMTGGAIGHGKDRNERRLYRQMADANVDIGIERAIREGGRQPLIIMPDARVQ